MSTEHAYVHLHHVHDAVCGGRAVAATLYRCPDFILKWKWKFTWYAKVELNWNWPPSENKKILVIHRRPMNRIRKVRKVMISAKRPSIHKSYTSQINLFSLRKFPFVDVCILRRPGLVSCQNLKILSPSRQPMSTNSSSHALIIIIIIIIFGHFRYDFSAVLDGDILF